MSRLILLGIALFLSFSLCAGSLQEIDGTLHRLQSAANASLDGLNNTQQVELIQSLRHIAQTINNEVSTLEKSIDDFWILFAATLVFCELLFISPPLFWLRQKERKVVSGHFQLINKLTTNSLNNKKF